MDEEVMEAMKIIQDTCDYYKFCRDCPLVNYCCVKPYTWDLDEIDITKS